MAEPASETLFDALVRVGDHFIDCFTIVERESPRRCLYVNDAFTRSTGYTPDEVVGKNLGFLQGPDDQQIVDAMRDSLNRNLAF